MRWLHRVTTSWSTPGVAWYGNEKLHLGHAEVEIEGSRVLLGMEMRHSCFTPEGRVGWEDKGEKRQISKTRTVSAVSLSECSIHVEED